MPHVTIRHDAITRLCTQMRESFDGGGPVRVAVDALIPDRRGACAASSVTGEGTGRPIGVGGTGAPRCGAP
jgi:hypothetical protein